MSNIQAYPNSLIWLNDPVQAPDAASIQAAEERQQVLTKPTGALGEAESVAVQLAGLQGREKPDVERIQVCVFAADHGIAASGVSAYPQAVTAQMISNFAAGGAAVTVLARHLKAEFEVINLGTVAPLEPHKAIVDAVVAPSTADFSTCPAMLPEQLAQALNAGFDAVERCADNAPDLFIAGEMGIGNTSSATALAALLLRRPVAALTGPGTGLEPEQVRYKAERLEAALLLHQPDPQNPLAMLEMVGGFEIAAMTGAYLRAAQRGIPVLVDGLISTVAATLAIRLNNSVRPWMLFGHQSAEPAHQYLLQDLEATPLLQLGMRLGEGSGAVMAVDILRAACRLHNEMATFAEAGVADKSDAHPDT